MRLDITDAVGIAAGGNHSLAVTRTGAVYVWGYNIANQLGLGGMPEIRFKTGSQAPWVVPYPTRLADVSGVIAVAAGASHSLALLKDGTIRAWGENRWGQLGDGTTVNRPAPVAVTGVSNAVAIVATISTRLPVGRERRTSHVSPATEARSGRRSSLGSLSAASGMPLDSSAHCTASPNGCVA